MNTINILLKTAREELNLSINSAAKLSGISTSYISRVEKGERTPSLSMLNKFSEAYGVDIKKLMETYGVLNEEGAEYSCDSPKLKVYGLTPGGGFFDIENSVGCFSADITAGQQKGLFAVCAPDNTMSRVGILQGATVIVKKQKTVKNGEIALVSVKGRICLKRYYKTGNMVTMFSEGEGLTIPEAYKSKDEQIKILGKAVKVVSNL